MKRGIKMFWEYSSNGRLVLRITKARGKFTLSEIEDLLLYEDNQQFGGHYIMVLNCSESTVGGDGWLFDDGPGDAVDLYKIEDGDCCPVCGNYTPPFEYCPNCGVAWKDMDMNVEKLLASMRPNEHDEQAYWSYVGALSMAKLLGFITEDRKQELISECESGDET